MFIPRVSPAVAPGPSPSATRLRDHGRWQRALRRATASIAERLPGFRGRYAPDTLVDAAEAVGTRAGRRQRLKDSPHLGHIVDIYV
ncbi:hypothetical protein [Ferrovibrio xuzhouensis]|uniref:Uncharacterized protein n=1 Tax=Ferrovibrio xuzhouensis TaxID=1576914 RepID=A0ABV7VDG8_9PROT